MQEQKRQPMSAKNILLFTIVAGTVAVAVGGLVQGWVQNLTIDSNPEFFSVKCQQIWVVDEEGKNGILLSMNDAGGFIFVNAAGADSSDYQKAITLTIEETSGVLRVSGTEGSILATDDGIHVYDEDHMTITGSLPHHPHPRMKHNR